ncbi:hypothetical protein [Desulfosarcina cetonica]|uniref:hypothetical protein n=1 Tax=Desulfosarcina cetonica TaxID=90730 RepID=UPI0006D24220|nr:hypothetical protein [Desulfosarcina cetonica]
MSNTMNGLIKIVWKQLGGIHLTVILCLFLVIDLTIGYICLNRHTILFAPLNDVGLMAWIRTYGRTNLARTAWFFALLLLLTLLCINTFVCTTDRVAVLIARRSHIARQHFVFKFAPHIMHYAMIVILVGYLCSYLFAEVLVSRTLIPGMPFRLPGSDIHITLVELDPLYYPGSRLPAFENRVLQPRARLRVVEGDRQRTATLNINHPLRCHGYSLFLKDFTPKRKEGGMNRSVRIDLTVRKDPGVPLYLAGIVLFSVGLALYLAEWVVLRNLRFKPIVATKGET